MAIVPKVKSRGVDYDQFEESGILTPYDISSTERASKSQGFRDFLGKYASPDQIAGALYSLPVYGTGLGSKGLGIASDIFNFPETGAFFSKKGDEYFDSAGRFAKEGLLGEYPYLTLGTESEDEKSKKEIAEISKNLKLRPEFVKAQLERDRKTNIEKIKKMPEESSIFDEDVDMSLMGSIAKAAEQAKQDEKTNLDAFPKLNADEAIRAENEAKRLETIAQDKAEAEAGYEDGGEDAYEKLQNSALEDIAKSKGETVTPATREELLAKYKKEFYEATGLDPSGKADKSSALMAMGLALMQNKAGKGFNVGRMLSAVGEAGEKALPKLEAAKKTAKAEALAAGKYALGRIQAGESAQAAVKAASLKHVRAMQLENLKAKNDYIKSQNEKGADLGSSYGAELSVGAKPIKYRMTYNKTTGQDLIKNPVGYAQDIKNRYADAKKGFDSAKELRVILQGLQASASAGGTAGLQFKESIQRYAKTLGWNESTLFQDAYDYRVEQLMRLEKMTKEEAQNDKRALRLKNISFEDNAQILQDALLARFKRFMTQETGNGISTFDIKTAAALTGKIETFGDVSKSIGFIGELEELFNSSLNMMDDAIANQLTDRDFFISDQAFDKTQSIINSIYAPKKKEDGKKIIDVADS